MKRTFMDVTYTGVVRDTFRWHVVVVFEAEENIVEHTYTKDQFIDGELPSEGTRLECHLTLTEPDDPVVDPSLDDEIDLRVHRKNMAKPPYIF